MADEQIPLTPKLSAKLQRMFSPSDAAIALQVLEAECSAFPLVKSEAAIERIRCAVLKLSCGSLEKLSESVRLAQRDWRDVLVWSGFGSNLNAHIVWLDEV